jgi:trans-aconitate 2-methyltransferase
MIITLKATENKFRGLFVLVVQTQTEVCGYIHSVGRCAMKWDAEKYDAVKAPQVDAGRELVSLARVREDEAILDLGCGTGMLTVELARLTSKGHVVGLDPSGEMLDKAKGASTGIKNVRYVQAPAQVMSFSGEFDLVFSNSAIQWIKEQEDVMKRVHDSLKPGGRIAIQAPARNFCLEFSMYTAETIEQLGLERYYTAWTSPWRFPGKEQFEALLSDTGFDAVKVFNRDYRLKFIDTSAVLAWWASAGLRPYLEPLPEDDQHRFKAVFAERFERNRADHGIEFGFRRLFAFGERRD